VSADIRVVVVDDHTLFRRGLVGLISEMEGIQVVGQAHNGKEALNVIPTLNPDVVLLDINMPEMSGIETLKALRERNVEVPVLMLTISQQDEDLVGAILAGASGYLLKNTEPEALLQTIQQVVAGKSVLAPEITKKVFDMLRSGHLGVTKVLTERESQVLGLLSRGLNTSQIAEGMTISENTVKTHVRNILAKLEVGSRAEAVAKAVQLNLI